MKFSTRLLFKNAVWTIGGYGIGQGLRFLTNVFLARLLAPDLFGVMLIVNSLVIGIALISDVGIGQNIIYHKDGDDPEFYNTAWSLQVIRSVLLWIVTLVVAVPLASFYGDPILRYILPVAGFGIVLSGVTSVSRFLLQKHMQMAKLMAFEIVISLLSSAAYILFAWLKPDIWALVFGGLFGTTATMVGSFFIVPDLKQRFRFSKRYFREILEFGKWIFLSSVVFFLSSNFDRLYLAKALPLDILGVYGIARSISELFGLVVLRVGNYVLFPMVASHAQVPREKLHQQLAPARAKFLLTAAVFFSFSVSVADLPITILYDQRYRAASWMLPILIAGAWSTILAVVNESTLLGLGKPLYSAMANALKFAFLLICLPIAVNGFGVLGGILVVSLTDVARYLPILVFQKRERFSFGTQDLLLTITVILLVGLMEFSRWALGFGTSFDALPI